MCAARLSARFAAELLLIVLELVLLPARLVAMLVGAVLVTVGLLGVPVWLIQLLISIAGGSHGAGPLPAWEMCVVLAAAVPAGVGVLELANLHRSSESVGALSPAEGAIDADRLQEFGTAGGPDSSTAAERLAPVALEVRKARALHARFARHQLRLRTASRSIAGVRRRQRGGH